MRTLQRKMNILQTYVEWYGQELLAPNFHTYAKT